ncbi:hypothetical protein Naga_100519g4 [Nannochloropsis gaditana]|uniref:Uncharacterized protein n=1 Tax=Nannochloropsis gaditana TaxID=72520 RepID=W7TBA8_9STRA|nr:hypothetical protein Naga_100519g4 [Nannochloropsis gaditana]
MSIPPSSRPPRFGGKGNGKLEMFKFGLYVSIPVIASIIYGTPDNMQNIVNKFRYVEYPAEDNRDGDVLVGQSISKEERARAMAALEKKEDTKSKGDDTAAETKKGKWGGLWKA